MQARRRCSQLTLCLFLYKAGTMRKMHLLPIFSLIMMATTRRTGFFIFTWHEAEDDVIQPCSGASEDPHPLWKIRPVEADGRPLEMEDEFEQEHALQNSMFRAEIRSQHKQLSFLIPLLCCLMVLPCKTFVSSLSSFGLYLGLVWSTNRQMQTRKSKGTRNVEIGCS